MIGVWFSEDQRANIKKGTCFEEDWTTSLNINNYPTVNSEDNQEDVCIQLRNQQTCTSNNHN